VDPLNNDRQLPSRNGDDLARAYAALKREYDKLVANNLSGVFHTTMEGGFLQCNDAMAKMFGYADQAELMKVSAKDLYTSQAERERLISALLKERKLINFEITLKHRNGRAVEVLENVFLEEPDDGPKTIRGTVIDMTAMRQAEIEQAALTSSYRSLVEHMRDGVLVIGAGRVKYANPAAERLLGERLGGKQVDLLFVEEDRAFVLEVSVPGHPAHGRNEPRLVHLAGDGRAISLYAAYALHEGAAAVQLTLQDEEERQKLLRLRLTEEMNTVLREEINEHRRTQEALRRSKRFARSLVDSSLDMIMAADPTGVITEYNPAASLHFGYEPEEILGTKTITLYADPEEFVHVQKELDAYGTFTGEIRNVSKTGKVFTSFLAASRIHDENGEFLGVMGVSRDITRMKQDQEALRASEERYRDLFENATDLIQSVDPDGRIQYVNNAWRRTLDYTEEEVAELRLEDIIHPAHLAAYMDRFHRAMAGKEVERIHTVFVGKKGNSVHVEGTTNVRMVDGGPVASRSIFTDITHVHLAREQLQQQEAKMRALFESSEHMFWTVDTAIRITSHNVGYRNMIERLHGHTPVINMDPSRPRAKFATPEYHAFWEEKYAVALGGKPIRFETDLVDQKGDRVCNEIFLSPVFDVEGKVTAVFGIGHEITEQIKAEDLVRHQASRLRAIFDNAANVMIWTLDRKFKITSFNDHFLRTTERNLGLTFKQGDDFVERMRMKLAHAKGDPSVGNYKAALRGKPQQFESELVGTNGQPVWVETFLNPIMSNGKVTELSCMAYGITDRKMAEQRLLQSLTEKEVLLKEVHHRVKNNLQVISSILSLQTAHVDGDERILELLRVSRDRIRTMSFIHESLYQNKDFSSIDMADYIGGFSRNLVMSYSLNGKVKLEQELQKVHLILDQAIPCGLILNELVSNAIKHAFPNGRNGLVRIGLTMEEETVELSVSDNGIGLPEGLNALHDGNLGLELVRTLVEQLDGTLKVTSGAGVSYLLTFGRIK